LKTQKTREDEVLDFGSSSPKETDAARHSALDLVAENCLDKVHLLETHDRLEGEKRNKDIAKCMYQSSAMPRACRIFTHTETTRTKKLQPVLSPPDSRFALFSFPIL